MFALLMSVALMGQAPTTTWVKIDPKAELIYVNLKDATWDVKIAHKVGEDFALFIVGPKLDPALGKEVILVIDGDETKLSARTVKGREGSLYAQMDLPTLEKISTAKTLEVAVGGQRAKVAAKNLGDFRKFAQSVPSHVKSKDLDLDDLEEKLDKLMVDYAKAGEKVSQNGGDTEAQAAALREMSEISAEMNSVRRQIKKLKSK